MELKPHTKVSGSVLSVGSAMLIVAVVIVVASLRTAITADGATPRAISIVAMLLGVGVAAAILTKRYRDLKRAHDKLDRSFTMSLDLLCEASAEGFFLAVNPAFTRALGHSMVELTNTPFVDFVHPDDVPGTMVLVEELSAGAQTIDFQNRYRHQDGSYRTLQWSASADPISGHIHASGRDVTEAVATALELDRFKAALDAHCIVSMSNATGAITYANDKFCDISTYSREELIGQDYSLVNSLQNTPEFISELKATIERGRLWKGVITNVAKDGTPYWVDTTIVPFPDENGEPDLYMSIRTDVTEQKLIEEALVNKNMEIRHAARWDRVNAQVTVAFSGELAQEQSLAQVLRSLSHEADYRPLAYYRFDPWQNGLVLEDGVKLPPGFDRKTFALGEGMVGDAASIRRPVFVAGGGDDSYELDTGVGRLVPAAHFALPVIHGDQLFGVLCGASLTTLTDTERLGLERVGALLALGLNGQMQYQELRETSEELDHRNRKVQSQNQRLQQADRLKSEFLASMSHELRTPLNAIIGFSDVLKDGLVGDMEPAQLDYVGEIFDAGHHLLSLINDILDLSKIEAGKTTLDIDAVELEQLARNAITIVSERAATGGLTLSHTIEPELAHMDADGRMLRQIVYNLMSNAVKFTRSGGTVELSISAHGDEVEIAVTDSGIGISPEDQERVFESFEQADGGLDRQFEGTGLGLALVKKHVELHGGTVGLTSEVGVGSRFWVRLPATRSSASSASSAAAPIPVSVGPASIKPASNGSKRVLVIDDDPAVCEQLRLYLEQAGLDVTVASDIDDALERLGGVKPDLITLDLMMPGMDGFSFLAGRTDHRTLRGVPVLVVSGADRPERALGLGANAILEKPIRRHDFLDLVDGLLAETGKARPLVLVIDDDPSAGKVIASYVTDDSVEVVTAMGGRHGLDSVAVRRPDLIILDLMMPEVNGFDVLNTLRGDPETAMLPVVVLSAKTLSSTERSSLAHHAQAVLSKGTVGRRQLLDQVDDLLGAARARIGTTA